MTTTTTTIRDPDPLPHAPKLAAARIIASPSLLLIHALPASQVPRTLPSAARISSSLPFPPQSLARTALECKAAAAGVDLTMPASRRPFLPLEPASLPVSAPFHHLPNRPSSQED
ncbi:hypothetical protein HDU82_004665 [Entophlyctis luteolus]|nr:hypothetical protein HDU82_004665 [Entophlyctis luteolus]